MSDSPSTNYEYRAKIVAAALPESWRDHYLKLWLSEDGEGLDIAAGVVGNDLLQATILAKQSGILAGKPFVDAILEYYGCKGDWQIVEGAGFIKGTRLALISGPGCSLLRAERLVLNLLARTCGISTQARRALEISKAYPMFAGTIAGTRKTTPGFRLPEKYALSIGGVDEHRYSLCSMLMLKDNHLLAMGSITNAIVLTKSTAGFARKVEVECATLDEAQEALEAGADIVMLDNVESSRRAEWAPLLKSRYPHALLEVSGGISMETLCQYCVAGVDVISMGGLTLNAPVIDLSMQMVFIEKAV